MTMTLLQKSRHSSGGIRQTSVAQDLEQQVKETGVAFSNSSSNNTLNGCSRTRAVSRPSVEPLAGPAHQSLHRGRTAEFVQIEPNHPGRVAEEEFRQRLGHFRLAGASWANEKKGRERFAGPRQPGLDHRQQVYHPIHCRRLTHHTLGEPSLGPFQVKGTASSSNINGNPVSREKAAVTSDSVMFLPWSAIRFFRNATAVPDWRSRLHNGRAAG